MFWNSSYFQLPQKIKSNKSIKKRIGMLYYIPLLVLHSLKIIQLWWVSCEVKTPAIGQSHIFPVFSIWHCFTFLYPYTARGFRLEAQQRKIFGNKSQNHLFDSHIKKRKATNATFHFPVRTVGRFVSRISKENCGLWQMIWQSLRYSLAHVIVRLINIGIYSMRISETLLLPISFLLIALIGRCLFFQLRMVVE